MRWDDLFADLEAQLDRERDAELRAEVADRSRRELATVSFLDRSSAHVGADLQVGVSGAGPVRGRLVDTAHEWLLLVESPGREVLVPTAACHWVVGFGRAVARQPEGAVTRRLGLASALRSLAQQRVTVNLRLTDGAQVTGTIDRVQADHLDLAEHPADESRRRGTVRAVRAVRFAAIALVRPV